MPSTLHHMQPKIGPASNSALQDGAHSGGAKRILFIYGHTAPAPADQPEAAASGDKRVGHESLVVTAGVSYPSQRLPAPCAGSSSYASCWRWSRCSSLFLSSTSRTAAAPALSAPQGAVATTVSPQGVPTMLNLMGILSLAGALVLEAWKTSLGVAVIMGCVLCSGAAFCLLVFVPGGEVV